MKKKTKSKKKLMTKKEAAVNLVINIRQVKPRATEPGTKHIVRLVDNCNPSLLVFDSIDEVNEFLFEFDYNNHGQDPRDTGTWIDQIVTDVHGEIYDSEELEADDN